MAEEKDVNETTAAETTITEQVQPAQKEESATPATPSIILHQFSRSSAAPSLSPVALKLETFLRMGKISYQNDFKKPSSTKSERPWITYDGQTISDAHLAAFFKEKTGLDMESGMSESEKGVARAFRKLAENELVWILTLWHWVYDKEEVVLKELNSGSWTDFIEKPLHRNKIIGHAVANGIGRHSQEEVFAIGQEDIKAIGDFLGSKKYLMGDTPSEVDCAVFGLLAEFFYVCPTCPLTTFIKENYPNLVSYCDNIKAEFWADWDDICKTASAEKEAKKKATKKKSKHSTTVTTAETTVVDGEKPADGAVNGHGDAVDETKAENGTTNGEVNGKEAVNGTLENGTHEKPEEGATCKTNGVANGHEEAVKENGHHEQVAVPAV